LPLAEQVPDEEIKEFGDLWHDRVKMVLLGDYEGMFVVKE
jgi:hypothetical protein